MIVAMMDGTCNYYHVAPALKEVSSAKRWILLHLKFIDEAALIHSVFSEAFLVRVVSLVTIVMFFAALREVCFWILSVPTFIDDIAALRRSLFEF